MVDRHRSISGVASELCGIIGSRAPDNRELEEGSGLEDIDRPRDISTSSSGEEYDGLEHVFFHSSLGVTSSVAVTSRKSDKMRGRTVMHSWCLLAPSRKRGSRVGLLSACSMAGSKTATEPLTVSVVH